MRPIPPRPLDLRDPRTFAIIGAAIEVHRHLGPGFLEPVYQEALSVELTERCIPHRREVEMPVYYRGTRLLSQYRADFLCFEAVVVELKAVDNLTPREQRQVIHYLKAVQLQTALLINFGSRSLQFNRFINTPGMTARRESV
jgi:GxxExxY protein